MRAAPLSIALALSFALAQSASAADYDGIVVGVTPDSVAVKTSIGEVVVLTPTGDVKAGKITEINHKHLHRNLIVGQTISVRTMVANGTHYSLGYKLRAQPKP